MTAYILRPATDDDFHFLFGLHRAAMGQYIESIWGWHDDWQEEYFHRKFEPQRRRIIQVDGRDAGVLVVEWREDEIYLGLIELLPEFQGRGIGAAIVTDLLAKAQARGLPLALHVLKTNHPARRLYERLGLRVVGEEAYRYRMAN
jgi:ribosomal protein S18 acetylase RimI-like enzyme